MFASWFMDGDFSLCPHMIEGARICLSNLLSIHTLTPFTRNLLFQIKHILKIQSPTIRLSLDFFQWTVGGSYHQAYQNCYNFGQVEISVSIFSSSVWKMDALSKSDCFLTFLSTLKALPYASHQHITQHPHSTQNMILKPRACGTKSKRGSSSRARCHSTTQDAPCPLAVQC